MDVDGVPPPGPSNSAFEEDTPTCKSSCFKRFTVVFLTGGEIDTSIEAPPSLLPARKYCDITGLEARTHSVCSLSWCLLGLRHVIPIQRLDCVITTRTYIT